MPIRIAINGLGRIGRAALKVALAHPDAEVVGVNDLSDPNQIAHLINFDSVYGQHADDVSYEKGKLIIGNDAIEMRHSAEPAELAWGELDADIVIESTGFFTTREKAQQHIDAGAKGVVISANCKDPETTNTFIYKVNTDKFDPSKDQVSAMGSCTTNCLAPVAKVLDQHLGIVKGLMTTSHSYTSTQNLVDAPNEDIRRARSAALSQIPTTTGAAKAISRVLPQLEGKVDGRAIRVPTPTVSLVDFVVELEKETTVEEINALFSAAAEGELSGVLAVESRELVSNDFKSNPHGSIVDLPLTMMADSHMAKVFSWYDNEWGYASRLIDYAVFAGTQLTSN